MTPRLCLLPDRRCIEVGGADATHFLHGQLSQTLEAPSGDRAPLAGWHDARGRLRALFRVVRLPDSWLLITERDMVESTVRRLRMFVLRAAVTIAAAEHWQVVALLDADDASLSAHGLSATQARDTLVSRSGLHWIRVGPRLWHALGERAAIDDFAPDLDRGGPEPAVLAEIELGIPVVTAPLAERFVPQMLNLDCLGALSFDKGCYPGQEVIARVHNLGSVKRRMRRYAADARELPPIGAEILNTSGRAVGEIVRAASAPHGIELLAVVEHAAVDSDLFLAGSGARLREQPLPYDIPRR